MGGVSVMAFVSKSVSSGSGLSVVKFSFMRGAVASKRERLRAGIAESDVASARRSRAVACGEPMRVMRRSMSRTVERA